MLGAFFSQWAVHVCLCQFHLGCGGYCPLWIVSVRVSLHVVSCEDACTVWKRAHGLQWRQTICDCHFYSDNKSQSVRALCLKNYGIGKKLFVKQAQTLWKCAASNWQTSLHVFLLNLDQCLSRYLIFFLLVLVISHSTNGNVCIWHVEKCIKHCPWKFSAYFAWLVMLSIHCNSVMVIGIVWLVWLTMPTLEYFSK